MLSDIFWVFQKKKNSDSYENKEGKKKIIRKNVSSESFSSMFKHSIR